MRINQFLAHAGLASRRECEKFVTEGRVSLNGKILKSLAVDINPSKDIVTFDGNVIEPVNKHVYYILHKPKGYVSTVKDDKGRKTVMDLMKVKERVFPVGRLDYDTEGLLLFTSDGELANNLTHPSHEVTKTYVVKIEGFIEPSQIQTLSNGVYIDGVKTKKCAVRLLELNEKVSKLEVILTQGLNRQIKKMFESIGKNVIFLKRTAVGELYLGGLSRGAFRALKKYEIDYLKSL